MGRIAFRNNTGLLDRPSSKKKRVVSIKSLKITAYKLRSSLSGITIICTQTDPMLRPVYGQQDLHVQLYMSWKVLRLLRTALSEEQELSSFNKAACLAWLQKYLRSASNLDALLTEIRNHKWPYMISATTLF